jgi:hypothetical protein
MLIQGGIPHKTKNTRRLPRKFLRFWAIPLSAFAVLIGHQQQAADNRQVLEQLNPLHFVCHVAVEDQRRGDQEPLPHSNEDLWLC